MPRVHSLFISCVKNSAICKLQQTTISNMAVFSKITKQGMIFYENRLLAYLIFSKIRKVVTKCVVCCCHERPFTGQSIAAFSKVANKV